MTRIRENGVDVPATFDYDPLGRLSGAGNSPGTAPAIAYENYVDRLVAERTPGSSTIQRRHVFGAGTDEPLVWYEGSDRRYLHADERGSIVAVTNGSGGLLAINRYDEYGRTQTTSSTYMGRFLYTGQRYFGGFGLYHYKNRIYDPAAGRFMQPDPIGYDEGMNLYAYVGGDPVNFTDPLGLSPHDLVCDDSCNDVVISGGGRPSPGGILAGSGVGGRFMLEMPIMDGGGGGGSAPADDKACPTDQDKVAEAAKGLLTALEIAHLGPKAILLAPFLLTGDTPQQYVVMGGLATPGNLVQRTTNFSYRGTMVGGFSASSAPHMTPGQIAIAANIPNGQISYTTVRDLAAMGIGLIPTPFLSNSLHVTVAVPVPLSQKLAQKISDSLTREPNPNRCK